MTNACFSTSGTARENVTTCDFYEEKGAYLQALGIPSRDKKRHPWGK